MPTDPTLPTVDALVARYRSGVLSRRTDLTDWNDGSFLDSAAHATALVGQEILRVLLSRFGRLFFATNERAALVELIQDRFQGQLVVQGATPALATVTFTRPNADAGAGTIPAGAVVAPSSAPEVTFTVVAAVAVDPAALTVDAVVQADAAGPAGNLAEDAIDTVVSTLFDPTFTVTQPERAAGGNPEETPDELRAAVAEYYQHLSRGVRAAVRRGALQVAGVRVAEVDESHVAEEDGGFLRVLVADQDGNYNQALVDAVTAELPNWVSAGVVFVVAGLHRLALGVDVTLRVTSALAFAPLVSEVTAALVAHGRTYGAGAGVYLSQLERVAINVSSADRGGAILDADARIVWTDGTTFIDTDLSVDLVEVPRLDAALITVRRA